MSDTASAADPARPTPTLLQLFIAFASTAVVGFGGVLPWTYRMLVEKRRWLTATEFNELFSLAQFLPGPNTVNLSVVFGARLRGAVGAVVALVGLLGPPVTVILIVAVLYVQYGHVAALHRVLLGISAAAAGLMIATSMKMAQPLLWPLRPHVLVALAGFIAVGLLRWPLPWVLLALAPVSVALAWWWESR
ncbi:MAG TPA: chromate transporter [Pseudolabrys sp.]|nr:chromate transporter [Pseudolabrys sp.]